METKHCIIVDPYISSRDLCVELSKNNIQPIAVLTNVAISETEKSKRFPRDLFADCIEYQDPDFLNLISKFNIVRVLAGYDATVTIADEIAKKYNPQYANNPETSFCRSNKYEMQELIKKAGLNSVNQIKINESLLSEEQKKQLSSWKWPLITKPTNSLASVGVKRNLEMKDLELSIKLLKDFHPPLGEAVNEIIIQECLEGDEYFVDTVSLKGFHKVISVFRYNKILYNNMPIYRYAEIIDLNAEEALISIEYVKSVLSTLQLNNGFAHTEIFLTKEGPCLIEVNPRISGAYGFPNKLAWLANKRTQPDFLVRSILKPDEFIKYEKALPSLLCHGLIVFVQAWRAGYLNPAIKDEFAKLSSFKELVLLRNKEEWVKPPENLYDTIGVMLLVNKNKTELLQDYERFLEIESEKLIWLKEYK